MRRTRIRRALQSTSRQRRANSSPWRIPVIAAVRYITRSTRPSAIVGHGAEQRLDLLGLQEADVGVGLGERRLLDALDRVLADHPALVDRELDQRVQRPERVRPRLRREPLALERRGEATDVLAGDLADRLGPKKSTMWIRSQ